jgi:hypothetical protein
LVAAGVAVDRAGYSPATAGSTGRTATRSTSLRPEGYDSAPVHRIPAPVFTGAFHTH